MTPDKPTSRPNFLHVFPSYGPGGAELRVSNIINFMGPGAGHAILSIDGITTAQYKLDPACQVPVFTAPGKRGWLRFPVDLWSLIREISPRVILTYNWGASDALLGARLNRFCPLIHNECGLSNEIDGVQWRRTMLRRVLLPGIFRTVVTSATMLGIARERFGVPESQISYIKTGVDVVKFQPGPRPEIRNQFTPGPNGVVFGYLGSLRASKNVGMVVRCFAKAARPEDRLAIFGEGPVRPELEAQAAGLGIGQQVRFMGHQKDIAPCFRAVDVYVTTSRSEQASNSLLEAMATGLPAVSTEIADNRLLLSPENRRFVFAPDDDAGYTEGLREIAANEGLRRELGHLNRRRTEVEYPLDRMFHEYAALWQAAAQASRN